MSLKSRIERLEQLLPETASEHDGLRALLAKIDRLAPDVQERLEEIARRSLFSADPEQQEHFRGEFARILDEDAGILVSERNGFLLIQRQDFYSNDAHDRQSANV